MVKACSPPFFVSDNYRCSLDRMNTFVRLLVFGLALTVFLVAPDAAYAYGGPGSVISGIGAFLALVAALLASLLGFIWFPLKRLYQKVTADAEAEEATTDPSA